MTSHDGCQRQSPQRHIYVTDSCDGPTEMTSLARRQYRHLASAAAADVIAWPANWPRTTVFVYYCICWAGRRSTGSWPAAAKHRLFVRLVDRTDQRTSYARHKTRCRRRSLCVWSLNKQATNANGVTDSAAAFDMSSGCIYLWLVVTTSCSCLGTGRVPQ